MGAPPGVRPYGPGGLVAAWAVRSRQEPVPVPVMWASKVSRPAMAAQSRGPVKVAVHSEKADSPGR